jgi:xylan 1,4-beta-xylosidase
MIQSSKAIVGFLAVLAAAGVFFPTFATTYAISVDGTTKKGSVPHFWSRCVGTGGAQLCLNAEWKIAAKMGVDEAGFQAFRGHRILSASNPINWSGSGAPTYNWTKFDQIYDFLVDSLRTVPVVELSSMPTNLQTNGEWSPPKDYNVWGNLIKEVVSHCITRYGKEKVRTWFFEVWNEWDYSGFWTNGTEAQYYQLYQKAVEGALSADSMIMIGGPSTTGSGKLQAFVNYCKTNNLKVDFLTNHCYGGGASGPSADPATVRNDNRTRAGVIKSSGKKMFSLNTEYNSSYSGQGGNTGANCVSMDNHINAPFVAKCVKLVLDDHTAGTYQVPDAFSYWAISDVFDEGSYIEGHSMVPFGEVFGLINYQGIRKATFNAFKMLHMMGATRLSLSGGTNDADGVDGFATINGDNSQVAVMVYNFYKSLSGQTAVDDVSLTVNNLPFPNGDVEVRHYRVDETHGNAYGVWVKQGKPAKPSTAQWDEMRTASNLAELNPMKIVKYTGAAYTESFTLPRQGISLLLFKNPSATSIRPDAKKPSAPALSFSGGMVVASPLSGRDGLFLSIFSMDGKLIKSYSTMERSIDVRKVTGSRGLCLVRAQAGGKRMLTKFVNME